jgi:hypothetical protein
MQLSGQVNVGNEATATTQELRIFDAAKRRADSFMG